ncbi:hypothetical protein PVIIG_05238, partial [Plasmodium vivax India VII]
MSDIDEDEQIPRKFYKRLDNPEGISHFQNLRSHYLIGAWVEHEVNKQTFAKLERNLKLIISEYSRNHEKRCRDINYWMDQKMADGNNIHRNELKSHDTSVFNGIKYNKGGKEELVCYRKKNPYKMDHVEIKKNLDDYCEIRDNIRCNILLSEAECLKYNRYIKRKKRDFTREIQDICSANSDCSLKDFEIGDN